MLKIRFSHQYFKLAPIEPDSNAKLLFVTPIHLGKGSYPDLLDYDTLYWEEGEGENRHYHLKPGDYVLLLFRAGLRLFTTIRPRKGRYGDKLEYYSAHIGEDFEIVIKEEK